MSNDISFYSDYYSDPFITHGGLFSKRSIDYFLTCAKSDKLGGKYIQPWHEIKRHCLKAINTHDEVKERQPILLELFRQLKLGKNLGLLQAEGDILLRDFVVEVKQPSNLSLSSSSKTQSELNDQQLLRAMKYRKKHWGILTNAAEWQFFYISDFDSESISNPFISFSLIDLFDDEQNGKNQIILFINLLSSPEFRQSLLIHSNENKFRSTESFSVNLNRTISSLTDLGANEETIDLSVELIFKLTFLFYCEDIGVLPRIAREYAPYDLRKSASAGKKITKDAIKKSLKAFASQKWSTTILKESGNEVFWDNSFGSWIDTNFDLLVRSGFHEIWFNSNFDEYDMSEISSSDLCDAYQVCVKSDSENVGTVYTSQGLSNYINSSILHNLTKPLKDGDLVFDPACGSGHLLKRIIFICERLLPAKYKVLSKNEMVEVFCTKFLSGMDKNKTAVLIAKINIWLSCVQKGKSLQRLDNFNQVNTLEHFKKAFIEDKNSINNFILGEGKRFKIIVSNPPWSMVHSNHPEKWIAKDVFWNKHKDNISRQDNLAFNFAFLSHKLLCDDGISVMIMPGVFFVGSTSKIRDYLLDYTVSYAPSVKNIAFASVSPTQNFGVITFGKTISKESVRVVTGIDTDTLSYFDITRSLILLPDAQRKKLAGMDRIFPTRSLLPLFSSYEDYLHYSFILTNSAPCDIWQKGSKGKPVNGEHLLEKKSAKTTKFLVGSENRGSSPNPILLYSVSKQVFTKCSHKVIKLDLKDSSLKEVDHLVEYFNSEFFNRIIRILRTSKSVQSAILNVIGMPQKNLMTLQSQYELLKKTDKIINKIKQKSNKAA